mmetsp:Transcript_512/g.1367  ORF Transcript_512/g.1367 Transcript_512/m.1367 type:complete len:310 (+) Transcript_512:555-1484(+)
MQRNQTAVQLSDLLEPVDQCRRQPPAARVRGSAGQRGHRGQDALWRGAGRRDLPLQVVEQRPALVGAAASVVVVASRQAIRGAADIVRDEHLRSARLGLVEGPELPQVPDALMELGLLALESRRVEVGQRQPPRARALLHADQLVLDLATVCRLVPRVLLHGRLQDRRHVAEREAQELRPDVLPHLAQPDLRGVEGRVHRQNDTLLLEQLLDGRHARARIDSVLHQGTEDVHGHERVHDGVGLGRPDVLGHPKLPPDGTQARQRLGVDELVDTDSQRGQLAQTQAVASEASLEVGTDLLRHALAQRVEG